MTRMEAKAAIAPIQTGTIAIRYKAKVHLTQTAAITPAKIPPVKLKKKATRSPTAF